MIFALYSISHLRQKMCVMLAKSGLDIQSAAGLGLNSQSCAVPFCRSLELCSLLK